MMKRIALFISLILCLIFTGCTSSKNSNFDSGDNSNEDIPEIRGEIGMKIDDKLIDVTWDDNDSVKELKQIIKNGLTINMHRYGGFEQVGNIGASIISHDKELTSTPGDIFLYSSNQIVIFFGSNTWSYTKLGHINLNENELIDLLDKENVILSLNNESKVGKFDIENRRVLLNSGYYMPITGLGTWTLSNEQAELSTYEALKCGVRLIDTARYYGNEIGVGKGIKRAIDEDVVKREDIFVTTKIYGGNYKEAGSIIDSALKDLNLEYVDLLLIHQPGSDDEGVYKRMEEYVKEGKIHSIGISNYYTKEAVEKILSFAKIKPAIIQNENHIYYQNKELRNYVSKYGIVMESWYPFGGRGHTSENFNNDVILELANKYNKSSAQIVLRWQMQDNYIAIPGSSNPLHIKENYSIFDFELNEEDMNKIRNIDKKQRYENW